MAKSYFLYILLTAFLMLWQTVSCTKVPKIDELTKDTASTTNGSFSFNSPEKYSYINDANKTQIILSGSCSGDVTDLKLSGAVNDSVSCQSGQWSKTVDLSNSADGLVVINLSAQGSTLAKYLQKDTIAPSIPTVTSPTTNPYVSSTDTLNITGQCTTGHTVFLNGDAALNTVCTNNTYSFSVSETNNGTYSFTLLQKDPALNSSYDLVHLQWIKIDAPPAPIVTSPSVATVVNNQNSLTVAGTCQSGNEVEISGLNITSDSQTCSGTQAFSFAVSASLDNTYGINITQTNAYAISSAATVIQWTRDTVVPSAATINWPPTNPYTSGGSLNMSGVCSIGEVVELTGDDSQAQNCTTGFYSFNIVEVSAATYNYSVRQKDLAGNVSSTNSQQWIKTNSALPAPDINTPAVTVVKSNLNIFTFSGICVTGYTVTLSGDISSSEVLNPSQQLTQNCSSNSFSFEIAKTADGNFLFQVSQSDGFTSSSTDAITWVRDTVAPTISISSAPSAIHTAKTNTFYFSSSDPFASFECSIDGGTYGACSSPKVYSSLTNGNHIFYVRAIDDVGNTGNAVSHLWSQQAYDTLALYHFNFANAMIDSSLFTGTLNNPLNNNNTSAIAGKFSSDGRHFTSTSSQYLEVNHHSGLAGLNSEMTIDFWIKFNSLPSSNGQYAMLISKTGASPNLGWELGYKNVSGNFQLAFRGSLNGTSVTERRSSNCFSDTTNWHHIAVSWNKGSVTFYCDGVAKGTQSIGTVGSAILFNSTANLFIGRSFTTNTTYQYLNGYMDELRLSQKVRWTSGFSVPTNEYTPD